MNETFLRFRDLKMKFGLSRSTILRLEQKGQFPIRKKLSERVTVWLEREVNEWIEKKYKSDHPHK